MDLGDIGLVDAALVPVPQGYAPDIGAFEYTTQPPPTPGADGAAPAHRANLDRRPRGWDHLALPGSGQVAPTAGPTLAPTPSPAPTPTPRVTPTPAPHPSGAATNVPPPTGGPGALDQFILLVGVLGAGGLLVAVFLARRSPG